MNELIHKTENQLNKLFKQAIEIYPEQLENHRLNLLDEIGKVDTRINNIADDKLLLT